MLSVNTNDSTAEDRAKFYIDGDRITSFSTQTNAGSADDTQFNYSSATFRIGSTTGGSYDLDAYLAEFNQVDGTALTPSTFGITDTSTGRWIPKTLSGITYGTNGFRLTFADSSAFGDDLSGNTNDFTATNLASTDQTTDSPTQNFSTLEGSSSGSMTLSEGNLRYTTASAGNWESVYNDKSISSGKWYFELTCKVTTAYDVQPGVILESLLSTNKNQLMGYTDGSVGYNMDGAANTLYYGNSGNNYVQTTGTQVDAGDIVGVAYDADTGAMWFAKNNTWVSNGTGVGNPSTGANPTWVQGSFAGQKVRFGFSTANASASSEVNFGQKSFTYTPPTDFKKLQQDNLPETAKGISGLVWTKNRDATDNHQLYDSSRGKQLVLASSAQDGESTVTDGLQKFLVGGQQIEDSDAINTSGESFVSWNWVANKGTTASNTDGSISSTVQANTTAGFSIVQYTGTGSAVTVGHGLSKKIDWMIIKELGNSNGWIVSHKGLTSQATYSLNLSNTNAEYSDAGTYYWNNTAPTSSVFSIATDTAVNRSSGNYVAYCWHEIDGFSKFGKYVGNSNADGTFVYTGFKPSFVLIKSTSTQYWMIQDSARWKFNPTDKPLFPSSTDAESGLGAQNIDLVSNGFKCRGTGATQNSSSHTYIYMAFAEHPFVGDGTNPVTAR
tara:strand:- start:3257 stop:5260 length:2004 start_codon:yes stop_codon:yes gene_type:complete